LKGLSETGFSAIGWIIRLQSKLDTPHPSEGEGVDMAKGVHAQQATLVSLGALGGDDGSADGESQYLAASTARMGSVTRE